MRNLLHKITPCLIHSKSTLVGMILVGETEFRIHGSVHRDSILIRSNKMQQYAGIYLLQNHSIYLGCPSHPSSGIHKIVAGASGAGHII